MLQNIVKSMVYIMNELGGDFKLGGYLYRPTNGILWDFQILVIIREISETSLIKSRLVNFLWQWCSGT